MNQYIPIPEDSTGFDLVMIRTPNSTGFKGFIKPRCKLHGAMNKVSKTGLWRCLRAEPQGKYKRDGINRDCRAGCKEINPLDWFRESEKI